MSVANANAFALLDDEGTIDAGELAAKLPMAQKDVNAKAETEVKQAGPKVNGVSTGGRGSGGPRAGARGGDGQDFSSFPSEGAVSEKPRHNTRNHGRGRRGRGDGERPRKRDFDRHDASGRGHETEKRHGAGRGNWGAEGEEVKELEEKLTLGEGNEPAAEAVEGEEGQAGADSQADQVQEEEEKQLTLEEYEAMLAEKRVGLNAQREAAFKVDNAQFQGMKAFEKVEEEVDFGLGKNAKGANAKGQKDKEKKERVVIDVGFRVQTADERGGSRGGRGGRGGRRGGRRGGAGGGGGGGGGRGGRGGKARIDVDDANSFPSLG